MCVKKNVDKLAKVKKLKKYESSYLKIIKETSISKTSLEPFSFNLRKYIVMICVLKVRCFIYGRRS